MLCLWTLSWVWGQNLIQHEVGMDFGTGISGVLYPDRMQFTPEQARVTAWDPSQSFSVALKYQALFLDGRFNLGAGLGYQRKGYMESRSWDLPGVIVGNTQNPIVSETVVVPLEVGYRLPLGRRHSLTADALFIPSYYLIDVPMVGNGNMETRVIVPAVNRFNFDMGLKLGYRLQVSEKWSLQASVLGTGEPFENPIFLQEMYNIQVVMGVRRQF